MAKIIDNNLKNNQTINKNLDNNTLEQNSLKQETTNQQNNKSSLVSTIAEFLPFAPLLFEKFTGEKVPQMTGTIAEINTSLQQVLANQQQIFNKISILENNANQQLNSLDKRLENLQSLKLTLERERKQIELGTNRADFNKSGQYNNNSRNSSETEEEY